MKTGQHPVSALCILLALPITTAQCSSTFTRNVLDLHTLKAQATPVVQNFLDGKIQGNSIEISPYFPAVSLDEVTSVNDFGCNTDIKNAHVFKLRLMRGDSSRFFIRNGGVVDRSWQTREIDRLCSTCMRVLHL